jgi:glyoxylase-like metal-dependent hydrolase (beta-lactamase superfamily II)
VNGAFLRHNGKTLVVYGDPQETLAAADLVLFTHFNRDVAWAGQRLVEKGAKAVVPAREVDSFTEVKSFWQKCGQARFHDYAQQTTKVLAQPLPVARQVRGGDRFLWEEIPIRVMDTPGYTRGAISYLMETEGKTIAFTGDLIYGDGRILDLYSFQDAIPEAKIGGYHGYAARLADLISSLRAVAAEKPHLLVPARGPIIADPLAVIELLIKRIQAVYANYLSIDALRWYFGDDHILAKAKRVLGASAQVTWMPMAQTRPEGLPDWILPIDNARLIRSVDGSGFLIDCGGKRILDSLQKMRQSGKLVSLEHVFITHYHDDHTDHIPAVQEAFGATVHACREMWDVLENPSAFRLPAMTANPIAVTGRLAHGTSWRWREFRFTAYYFPGQTLYHEALLVNKDQGETVFFIGDSFTPSGIDDYCAQNRNFLHEGMGYFFCLDLISREAPDAWLINQHVPPAFRFTPQQREHMALVLKRRLELLRDLFPWDDPNFGLDEGWARFYPYAGGTRRGELMRLAINIMNHSPQQRAYSVRVHAPKDWRIQFTSPNPVHVPPRLEGTVALTIKSLASADPGPHVLTADIDWDNGDLRQWTETIVTLLP